MLFLIARKKETRNIGLNSSKAKNSYFFIKKICQANVIGENQKVS